MIQRTLAFPITSHFFKSGSPIGYQENYDLERICGLVDFAGLLERDSAFAPDFARRQSPCAAPQDSLLPFFPTKLPHPAYCQSLREQWVD
jgi:hypothetical protein